MLPIIKKLEQLLDVKLKQIESEKVMRFLKCFAVNESNDIIGLYS